jgi:hypothetical protein
VVYHGRTKEDFVRGLELKNNYQWSTSSIGLDDIDGWFQVRGTIKNISAKNHKLHLILNCLYEIGPKTPNWPIQNWANFQNIRQSDHK